MSFTPDEIEEMKQIAANLEKCAAIMGQQIVIKDNKEVLQKDALNNIYRALCLYLTVSDIPIKQYGDILRRLFWDKPETAKRIEEQYYDLACFAPINWQKFDEAKQLTEIIRLQGRTKELAEDFRVCAEMAQRDVTPKKPAEIQQSQQTEIPSEIKLLEQVTDKLEEWAKRTEPKLPAHIGHISFYGSLLKALGNLPDLMLTFLRSHMPEQLDSIQKDLDDLYEKAKAVDHERSESGGEANTLKCQAQVAAKNFAQKLRLIVKMTKENLAAEKPAEPEQAYTGKEAWKKFIEKLSEVGNLEIPLYPFKAGKIQYLNFTNKPGYLKYGAYRFSKDDSDVIENTVGFPLTISKLRAFLVKNCSVQDPIDYSWPDIIAALSLYRNDLASLKPTKTDQNTTPAKPEKEKWYWRLYEKTLKAFFDSFLEWISRS